MRIHCVQICTVLTVSTITSGVLGQTTPVRSSVTSDSYIYLTPSVAEDQMVVVDDQLTSTNTLVSTANTQIIDLNGSFYGMSTGSTVFSDAESGSFSAGIEFGGAGVDEPPTAQTFGKAIHCEFQYDFQIQENGSFHVSGSLFNNNQALESIASFKVYREFVVGDGFGFFYFSQFVMDTENTGVVPFDFVVPLDADSGSYRVEMRMYSSSISSLIQSQTNSVLNATFSVETGSACPADLNNDDELDFFDISAFLTLFANQDPIGDFNNDGEWDFFDVSAFLTAYGEGCP